MKGFDVKEPDAAMGLAAKLCNFGENINAVCAALDKAAEDVLVLDQTAHLNEQLSDYLKEAADNLRLLNPGLEDVGKTLVGVVKSSDQFEDAREHAALGSL